MSKTRRPRLAVWRFTSCEGCERTLLDAEDEWLALNEAVELASFPEASRAILRGPYDLSLIQGSVTTAREIERLHEIRKTSGRVVTLGACATSGGVQALRNLVDSGALVRSVYPDPQHIRTLDRSTPISAHVKVDYELRGCPVNKLEVYEVVSAMLNRRRPVTATQPVCVECKLRGASCVTVTRGTPCLGPITHGGCNALCPSFERGCFGCYGASQAPNPAGLIELWRVLGVSDAEIERAFDGCNAGDEVFRRAALSLGAK
jgi:coenzyme F420-reducing hydrogenase gamma subunit